MHKSAPIFRLNSVLKILILNIVKQVGGGGGRTGIIILLCFVFHFCILNFLLLFVYFSMAYFCVVLPVDSATRFLAKTTCYS